MNKIDTNTYDGSLLISVEQSFSQLEDQVKMKNRENF